MKAVAASVWLGALLLMPWIHAGAAESGSRVIAPARSEVCFSVRKFWFAHETGTFTHLTGVLRRARDGGDRLVVDASLAVANLVMDDADDRARALGPDFFDAKRFPAIRFDSRPFPLRRLVDGGALRGLLTLHGQTRAVALTLLPSRCPRNPLACTLRAKGALSRSAFGMHALRGVLSDKVELGLAINLVE